MLHVLTYVVSNKLFWLGIKMVLCDLYLKRFDYDDDCFYYYKK